MEQALFRGCRLKVERAREHENAIRALTEEVFRNEPNRPRIAIRRTGVTDEYALYVDHMPDLTATFERVSLILGDAVHNLRSALDHLVFQLVMDCTKGAVQYKAAIQFPITDRPADFRNEVKRRLKEVSLEHVGLIESFQPYHRFQPNIGYSDQLGGHFHPLEMLRTLSNLDKHRQQLTVTIASAVSFEVRDEMIAALDIYSAAIQHGSVGKNQPVVLGMEIARARVPEFEIPTTDTAHLGRVPGVVEKRSGAFFRLVKCMTNAPPCRAATGGTRHGKGYQGRCAGAGA